MFDQPMAEVGREECKIDLERQLQTQRKRLADINEDLLLLRRVTEIRGADRQQEESIARLIGDKTVSAWQASDAIARTLEQIDEEAKESDE